MNEPLPYVSLMLRNPIGETKTGNTTNENGFFNLKNWSMHVHTNYTVYWVAISS